MCTRKYSNFAVRFWFDFWDEFIQVIKYLETVKRMFRMSRLKGDVRGKILVREKN